MHQPLSQSLAELLAEPRIAGGVTLNTLLERTEGRSVYLLVVLLCLPFLIPVSIPGMSTVMGAIVALLMLRQAFGRAASLPKVLGERRLPPKVQQSLVLGSIRFLRFLEKVVQPRRTQWLTWRPVVVANSCLVAFLAVLLALPLPAPPFFFSNSVPAYAIVVMAVSMMEEDGLVVWLGYALAFLNFAFFGLLAGVVAEAILKIWQDLGHPPPGA